MDAPYKLRLSAPDFEPSVERPSSKIMPGLPVG
jgi:hypothetical protein